MKIRTRIAAVAAAVAVVAGGSALATAPAEAVPTYYGAIALSPSTGATGWSVDYPTSGIAERAAVAACGYTDCQSVVWVSNGCAALANSTRYWGTGWGSTLYQAQSVAIYNAEGGYIADWVCTTGHSG